MRKTKQKPILYSWDSSTLLAWLRGEPEHAARIDLIESEISNPKSNARLVCSTLIEFEISDARHTPEKILHVRNFLKRRNVSMIDAGPTVTELAGKLRDALIAEDRKLKRADAIILATAIIHRADVLHSTDEHHLRLNGSPLVCGLKITTPEPFNRQQPLGFGT